MILKYDFENNYNFSCVLGVNLCQFEFVCKIHYNFELRRPQLSSRLPFGPRSQASLQRA